MSQVIKAQGGTTIYLPFTEGLRTTSGITYKNTSGIKYLEDKDYRQRYADYRNLNDQLRELFNLAADLYVNEIKNGKIDFTNAGLVSLDNNIDLRTNALINDYFISGVKSNLVAPYDESGKNLYLPNLSRIIAKNIFNNEDMDPNSMLSIWNALDAPDPKTGIRGTANRQKKYAEALRAEANKLENDEAYRNIFRFTGWQDDINAYKKTVAYLRQHADEIEKLSDFNGEDWYLNAAMVNLEPTTIKNTYFDTGSPLKKQLDEAANSNPENTEGSLVNPSLQSALDEEGMDYFDPLSTLDIIAKTGGKTYTVDDNWQNIDNDAVKKIAETILTAYGRLKIKDSWTYWKGYSGKYLENLTSLFENTDQQDFLGIYSVSQGFLTNKGKKFFIRPANSVYPIEVTLSKNPDGTYTATDKSSGKKYSLGRYIEDGWKAGARTFHERNDLGIPFLFDLNLLSKNATEIRNYMLELLKVDPSTLPTMMYANILMKLSYYFDKKAPIGALTIKLPNGSVICLGGYRSNGELVKSFSWTQGAYGIKFTFTSKGTWVTGKGQNGRATRYIDPTTIKSVEIFRPVRKEGGKITKLQYGGLTDVANFQEQNHITNPFKLKNLKPKTNEEVFGNFTELSKKQQLASDKDFTVADGIRTAAAGLDLLSSLMIFPKGLNIASAIGTGVSFLGYITSDIIDVIEGRLDFGDAAINDTLLLGTMAVPMFINPARAKALGMGQKALRMAGAFSKWFGWAVAAGMITNEETRKSLENTIGKISRGEITKLNSQDFTNVAFMIRLAGGVKEGVSRRKANKALEQSKIDNGTNVVKYTYKEGTEVKSGKLPVSENTDLSIKSIKQLILEQLNEGKPDELKLKEDAITVLEAKGDSLLKSIYNKTKETFSKESSETKSEPLAKVDLELGAATEPTPLYTRIFEKVGVENGKTIRLNTALGKFIRETLGASNFDVYFSDYNTVKNYRTGKINRLVNGLYKPLDNLREQGKRLYEITKQEGLSQADIDRQLTLAMRDFGFLENDPAVVEYAKRLASFYESDLAKYDNYLIAQMMLDKDIEISKAIGKEATGEVDHTNSVLNKHKLDYTTEIKATPEELQEAYNRFLLEKSNPQINSILSQFLNALPKDLDLRRQLVQKVFLNFNTDAITPIQIEQLRMLKLLMDTKPVKKALNSNSKGIPGSTVEKGLLELVKKGTITQEQADRLWEEGITTDLAKIIETDTHLPNLINDLTQKLKQTDAIYSGLLHGYLANEYMLFSGIQELLEKGAITKSLLNQIFKGRKINWDGPMDENVGELKEFAELFNSGVNKNAVIKHLNLITSNNGMNEIVLIWDNYVRTSGEDTQNWFKSFGESLKHDAIEHMLRVAWIPESLIEDLKSNKKFVNSLWKAFLNINNRNSTEEQALIIQTTKNTITKERLSDIKSKITTEASKYSTDINVSERINKILDEFLVNGDITLREKDILITKHLKSLKKLLPKKFFGGNIEFAQQILKMQEGNKIRGIQWTAKQLNWYPTLGKSARDYIFRLLNNPETEHLLVGYGDLSLYRLGKEYYKLRSIYDKDYAPNNWAYKAQEVKDYLTNFLLALPDYLKEVINPAYKEGRYSINGTTISGDDYGRGTDGSISAGTSDYMGLGNVNYMSQEDINDLLQYATENWKNGSLFYDVETGTIFPHYGGNLTTAPIGSKPLSEYKSLASISEGTASSGKTSTVEGVKDGSAIETEETISKQTAGKNRNWLEQIVDPYKLPEPEIGEDKIPGVPINPLRILSTLGVNAANIKANEVGKQESYEQTWVPKLSLLTRNLSKVFGANEDYGRYLSMIRNTSSDFNLLEAFIHNILNAHHKARQEGYDLNRAEFKESYNNAIETRNTNADNANTIRNTNTANATNINNANKLRRALMIMTNADNWQRFINVMTAELGELNKLRVAHNLTTKASWYSDRMNAVLSNRRQVIYSLILRNLSSDPETLKEFKTAYPSSDTDFMNSPHADAYRSEYNKLEESEKMKYYLDLEELFNSSYDGRRYWGDIMYKYFKPTWIGNPEWEKEQAKLHKLGGQINMARKGGASVNWVRVENARMMNKSILNDIKHTYDSLRDANRELQRSIRAMAPLIKQLSKQEIAKLK